MSWGDAPGIAQYDSLGGNMKSLETWSFGHLKTKHVSATHGAWYWAMRWHKCLPEISKLRELTFVEILLVRCGVHSTVRHINVKCCEIFLLYFIKGSFILVRG